MDGEAEEGRPMSTEEKVAAFDELQRQAAKKRPRQQEYADQIDRDGKKRQSREDELLENFERHRQLNQGKNRKGKEDSDSSDSGTETPRNWQTTERMLTIIFVLLAVGRGAIFVDFFSFFLLGFAVLLIASTLFKLGCVFLHIPYLGTLLVFISFSLSLSPSLPLYFPLVLHAVFLIGIHIFPFWE